MVWTSLLIKKRDGVAAVPLWFFISLPEAERYQS